MGKNFYAIEVETWSPGDDGAAVGNVAYGLTYGFLRVITDRPIYTGTDTGTATIPVGDNSVIKINLSGAETLAVAMQSGQLYAAANGIFKTINTVLAVRDRFTVLDNSDFTGGQLASAKGSAPAEGDMFEVTNNGSGTETVRYVGVNKWFEDFIVKSGLSNPSRSVDVEGSGDYGTLSGFTFSLKDTVVAGTDTPFWSYIAANGINLANRTVRFYAVIDDVFYQIWTGVIEENPRAETDFQFVCKPNIKRDHRDIPPEVISDKNWPDAIDNSKGEAIPICVGDVEYATSLNLSGNPVFIPLSYNGGAWNNNAEAFAYTEDATGTSIVLITPYVSVNQLAGKYLFVLNGGGSPDLDHGIRIISNTTSSGGGTTIILSEPIRDLAGNSFNLAVYGINGSAVLQDRWCFGVASLKCVGVISNKAITSFKKNADNTYKLFFYSDETKKYLDLRYLTELASISDSAYKNKSSENMATFAYCASNLSKNGDVSYLYPVPCRVLSVKPTADPTHFISPDISKLTDLSRATYIVGTSTPFFPGFFYAIINLIVAVDFPIDEKDIDDLYFGVDFSIVGGTDYNLMGAVWNTDIYSRRFSVVSKIINWPTLSVNTGDYKEIFNILPDLFYRAGGDLNSETSVFATNDGNPCGMIMNAVKLPSWIPDRMLNMSIGREMELRIQWVNATHPQQIKLKQVGFICSKTIDMSSTDIYTRVSGEKTTGGAESNTVYNAFRLMLETYDGIAAADIDYGNLPTRRHNLAESMWHVGRQLTERKNTADYIKELCEQSFVACFQNRKGKIALSAWRDRTDTPHEHNNTTIDRGTIGDWKLTSIDRVFNSFTVNYSRDPGGDKYFSAWQIADVNDNAANPGLDLGELWKVCNGAYKIYKTIKEFEIDCSWFIDRNRWYNTDDTGKEGIGVDGSAFHWLEKAVYWMTRQKRNVSYNIPLNATNVLCELCDPVNFKDPVYTNSLVETDPLAGAIQEIEYDVQTDSIRISSILQPNDTIDDDFGDIVETGSAATTITESGSQPDTITEDGNP